MMSVLVLSVDVELKFPCRLKTLRHGEPRKDEASKMGYIER